MVTTRSMARRAELELSIITYLTICSDSNKKSKKRVSFVLPFDLIIEILARLPVKSLIRFMLVCKKWYDLIQSPTFIDKHQITSPVITSILKHSSIDRLYINDEGSYKMINLDSMLLRQRCMCMLGICGGLVCAGFTIQDSVYIIGNPATRKFRQTSPCKLLAGLDSLVFFGFNSFANEYKLVRVVYSTSSTGEVVLKAEVYTMSTDSWVEIDVKMARVVDLIDYDSWYYAMMPVVLNGVFYWEAASPINMCVVSFDMSTGLFDQINVPLCLETLKDEGDHWKIVDFKEELSFVVSHNDRTIDLWSLNDKMTWTHKLRIDNIPIVESLVKYKNTIKVAGYTRSGELLIEDRYAWSNMKMLSYDLNSQKTKVLPCPNVKSLDMFYFYTESLRSVKPRNDVKETD